MYTVCASAVISPLRQWLDSYAKTRLKMCHTFKHFIHMQYFLLLTNLVIVFVHWVSTGVLYEPRECLLFWDYIPESKLCFCLNLCRPSVHIQFNQYRSCLTVKQRRAVGRCNRKQRCGSEFAKWHDIYTPEECADEWRQNNADSKSLENCVMNGFLFGIVFMTATGLENSPQSFDVYTVSQSRGDVRGDSDPRELASVNCRTPQWARGQFTRTIIPDWFEKWRDENSDTCVNCVVPYNYDAFPLLMMHKTCSINYGHLADLQKNTSYNWSK